MKNLQTVMTRDVCTTHPDTSIRQAAEQMKSAKVGALPVCRNGKVLGIVTDRDIVIRAMARGLDPERHVVGEIMSNHVVSCKETQSLTEAAGIMQDREVGRLIVMDESGNLKGILSLGKLTQALGKPRIASLVKDQFEASRGRRLAAYLFSALGAFGGAAILVRRRTKSRSEPANKKKSPRQRYVA